MERKAAFVSDTMPQEETSTQTTHLVASSSAVTSEVRPELMPDMFQQPQISDVVAQGVVAQSTIQPLTLTETATSESLAPMQTQPRPAESKAAIELPEQQSLVISQHQLVEQETDRAEQSAPQKQTVRVELATREAVVTGQQQQVQYVSDYQVQRPTAL